MLFMSSRKASFRDGHDRSVVATDRQIVDLDIVVRLATNGGALLSSTISFSTRPSMLKINLGITLPISNQA